MLKPRPVIDWIVSGILSGTSSRQIIDARRCCETHDKRERHAAWLL